MPAGSFWLTSTFKTMSSPPSRSMSAAVFDLFPRSVGRRWKGFGRGGFEGSETELREKEALPRGLPEMLSRLDWEDAGGC
jgi:hypothetical protein